MRKNYLTPKVDFEHLYSSDIVAISICNNLSADDDISSATNIFVNND